MTGMASSIWLPLFALFYVAVMLYWVRMSTTDSLSGDGFFSAGHALSPWISALVIAGASMTGWFVLGGSQQIAVQGFQMPVLIVGGVLLALPGTLFFKRLWFVAERMRVSSQADIFRLYYHSAFLVIVSVAVALLFALGFAGLQMRAIAGFVELMTGGAVSRLSASVVLGFILFAGAGIGGMRAIGYFGVIQTVLAFAGIVTLSGFALIWSGGFTALNAGLLQLSASEASAGLFSVTGVIHFTSGLGRGGELNEANTALANLSFAFALMGFQASPLILKLVLSTRSPNGIAAGQTWVTAGFFGAVIAFCIALTGAAGLVDSDLMLDGLLAALQAGSPWFAAWIFIGIAAGVQLLAGLALFVAGEGLIRHVYRPYFHSRLSKQGAVMLTRIAIAVLAVVAMLMENLTPVTLSALAALTLPLAFQLWTPLLGVTWLPWITRPAAVTGVGFGIAGVVLTEPLGYQVLSFFGLELPWGRWPWTIHSALWGMAANVAAVLIIAAITNRNALGNEAREIRQLFSGLLSTSGKARTLRATAWSVTLAWFFLAVGPGLIFGNAAFVATGETGPVWLLGMPSIWAWSLAAWICGVGLVWFLSYKMEMASPVHVAIPPYEPPLRLKKDTSAEEQERLRTLILTGVVGFALAVLIAFSFGG
jgi:solute:Na+ symporter, SSS family